MGIVDYIEIAAIALVIDVAVFYIVRLKRSEQNVSAVLIPSNAAKNAVAEAVKTKQRKTVKNEYVGMCAFRSHPHFQKRRLVLDNIVKFTFSQVKYIVWLYRLSQGVKNVEFAGALSFSKPSVHNMLKSLAELGIVRQQMFGLAFFTDEGRALAQKYAHCYALLQKKMAEICGNGAASENAICGLLADMPTSKIDELYNKNGVFSKIGVSFLHF